MAESKPRVGDQRPGGRAERVRNAVLTATAELLDEAGYDAVAYEEVARRAGVHKTTVYRRWPSKPELVADAVGLHSDQHVPIPNTGSFAGDLRALAAAVAANITSESGARRSTSIVAAAATSEELSNAMRRFMTRRVALAEPIVANAVARGELSANVDARVVVEALVGPIWFRLLLTGEPIDEVFLTTLAALVEAGTRGAAQS